MKRLIVPALSALLLTGPAAPADASAPQVFRLARNDRGGEHPAPGGAQPSPATVPAGAVDNNGPPANSGHGHGRGGATTTGGATAGGANTIGGLFTGARTPVGRTGRTGRAPDHGQGGATTTGGAATGGANTTGGLFTGTPTGHGTGGATNVGGGHAGTSIFGTRPPNWNLFPRTFSRGAYQRNITASRRFHWQTYRRPQGWYARRWVFGQMLPAIFWANDYWLNDYWMFDLPIPPYGYVWVRYGDDALLVNKRTGQVLQVVYGLFD